MSTNITVAVEDLIEDFERVDVEGEDRHNNDMYGLLYLWVSNFQPQVLRLKTLNKLEEEEEMIKRMKVKQTIPRGI